MWTLLKTCWVRLNSQCLQKVQFNPTKTAFINALWNKPSYSLKITPSLETPFKPLFLKFLSTFQVQWNLDPTVPHKISLFKWAFPDLFFVFSIQLIENKWFLEPMTGFEPRPSGIRSNRSANWATTRTTSIAVVSYYLNHHSISLLSFGWGKPFKNDPIFPGKFVRTEEGRNNKNKSSR